MPKPVRGNPDGTLDFKEMGELANKLLRIRSCVLSLMDELSCLAIELDMRLEEFQHKEIPF